MIVHDLVVSEVMVPSRVLEAIEVLLHHQVVVLEALVVEVSKVKVSVSKLVVSILFVLCRSHHLVVWSVILVVLVLEEVLVPLVEKLVESS